MGGLSAYELLQLLSFRDLDYEEEVTSGTGGRVFLAPTMTHISASQGAVRDDPQ